MIPRKVEQGWRLAERQRLQPYGAEQPAKGSQDCGVVVHHADNFRRLRHAFLSAQRFVKRVSAALYETCASQCAPLRLGRKLDFSPTKKVLNSATKLPEQPPTAQIGKSESHSMIAMKIA